jgi:hypothetical protein
MKMLFIAKEHLPYHEFWPPTRASISAETVEQGVLGNVMVILQLACINEGEPGQARQTARKAAKATKVRIFFYYFGFVDDNSEFVRETSRREKLMVAQFK